MGPKCGVKLFLSGQEFRDPNTVLLQLLKFKFAFLLALASGKRRELHALQQAFSLSADGSSAILKPSVDFLGKTHIITRGKGTFAEIILPKLPPHPDGVDSDIQLCQIKNLLLYTERTKAIRSSGQKRLIISHLPHFKSDIGKQSISNYIRRAVLAAYQNLAKQSTGETAVLPHFHPHEVRQVATSIKAATCATMDEILRAGT